MPISPSDAISISTAQIDLVDRMITANLGYLTLCVSILVILGGAHYLLNIKPEKERLDKYEEKLDEANQKIEERILKIEKFEERLEKIEKENTQSRLDALWNQHFIWQVSNYYTSDMFALIQYLTYCLDNKFKLGDVLMCLNQIKRVLSSDPGNAGGSVLQMSTLRQHDFNGLSLKVKFLSDLSALFARVEEHQQLKDEILVLAKEKWSL